MTVITQPKKRKFVYFSETPLTFDFLDEFNLSGSETICFLYHA